MRAKSILITHSKFPFFPSNYHTHMQAQIHMGIRVKANIHTRARARTRTHTHTHTHTHTEVYIYIYICEMMRNHIYIQETRGNKTNNNDGNKVKYR
jgi:hypothetical protein